MTSGERRDIAHAGKNLFKNIDWLQKFVRPPSRRAPDVIDQPVDEPVSEVNPLEPEPDLELEPVLVGPPAERPKRRRAGDRRVPIEHKPRRGTS